MGWEMWFKSGNGYSARMGFFCNTSDKSFGPVFYVGSGWDEGEAISAFHRKWASEGWMDPRAMDNSTLSDAAYGISEWMEKERGEE
tara:strand:+ start:9089 stop:9346 length:258 start_codon:yes stop_codon:yes gene_type:complete